MPRARALLSVLTILGALTSAAPALATSAVVPSPARLEFGPVDIHFGSRLQQSVQFSNGSVSTETVTSVAIKGDSSFQLGNDGCSNQMLPPASPQNCTVEVSFKPGSPGVKHATLELFTENGPETGMVEVPLAGEGITGTLSASPLSFSPIPYSGSGGHEEGQNETTEVTIRDSANAGTLAETVSIIGPDASSFSVQYGDCANNLMAPNNSCDEGIRFQPISPGVKHAQLVISSDSSSSPLVIPLEGEGLLGPKISLSSKQALLGEVLLGAATSQTFTVTNTGDYPLGIQQAFLLSGTPLMFPVLSDTCTRQSLAPGSSCAVTVGFQPTTLGEKDASILFITNTSLPLNVVGIDGVGIQPAVVPQTSSPGPTLPVMQASRPEPASPHVSGPPSQWLTLQSIARLFGVSGEEALETGITARCPAVSHTCEVQSFITAGIPARRSGRASASAGQSTELLGASAIQLQGGASTRVNIPLLGRAIIQLRNHGRVQATVGVVVRADGRTVASRTRAVTLVRPATSQRAAASRAAR